MVPASRMVAMSFPWTSDGANVVVSMQPGDLLWEARIVVAQAFSPGATVTLGDTDNPELLFRAEDVDLTQTNSPQYSSRLVKPFDAFDSLILNLDPGASTQGLVSVYINYWR